MWRLREVNPSAPNEGFTYVTAKSNLFDNFEDENSSTIVNGKKAEAWESHNCAVTSEF